MPILLYFFLKASTLSDNRSSRERLIFDIKITGLKTLEPVLRYDTALGSGTRSWSQREQLMQKVNEVICIHAGRAASSRWYEIRHLAKDDPRNCTTAPGSSEWRSKRGTNGLSELARRPQHAAAAAAPLAITVTSRAAPAMSMEATVATVAQNHDKAICHTSAETTLFLEGQKIELIGHPPHSPDLAPKDFYLFRSPTSALRRLRGAAPERVCVSPSLRVINSDYIKGTSRFSKIGGPRYLTIIHQQDECSADSESQQSHGVTPRHPSVLFTFLHLKCYDTKCYVKILWEVRDLSTKILDLLHYPSRSHADSQLARDLGPRAAGTDIGGRRAEARRGTNAASPLPCAAAHEHITAYAARPKSKPSETRMECCGKVNAGHEAANVLQTPRRSVRPHAVVAPRAQSLHLKPYRRSKKKIFPIFRRRAATGDPNNNRNEKKPLRRSSFG
ncbi:hypothetical protein EVAR_20104_1 [Eumeta japonica]|uniref:Histone-lysine N-methyltransferase SETMAR n=1 Tax=Eumeta variegata TaxID=151549 RepID=A0A4C1V3R4_EUMVA|nr:hypothetical protein EVAR_20104_1 [Eumeta japonica]